MNLQKNVSLLPAIEINSAEPSVASIIWLHGLGASNDDFVPVAAQLNQLIKLPLRYIFPQAPLRPVTINNGLVMPAWYDIFSFERGDKIDHAGITDSVGKIRQFIQQEQDNGVAPHNIILAGFSQGAVATLCTLLSSPIPFRGLIALSGYLPFTAIHPENHATPIFWGHGTEDDIVDYELSKIACQTLKSAQYPVAHHSYPMSHSVCDEEIRDLAAWIKLILTPHPNYHQTR